MAALPSANAAKHTKVPSSLSASRPVLPEEDWRSAFVPVALMGTMFTGAVWRAVEGLTSMMLKVVLLANRVNLKDGQIARRERNRRRSNGESG